MHTGLVAGHGPVVAALAARYHLAGRTVSQPLLAVVALLAALACLAPRRVWRVGRLGVTAVHEGGHATAALLAGRRVVAVHLRADTSGATFHYGSAGRVSRLVTTVAGYPAPGLLAVVGAWLCAGHHPRAWLALLAGLATVSLVLWLRNLFGVLVVMVGVGGLGWLVLRGTSGVDALIGAALVWYLAVGGLRSVIESNRDPRSGDAAELGGLVHLPAAVAKAGFTVTAATCVAVTAGLLLGVL